MTLNYKVLVRTSNVGDAGTNAKVYLIINGENGSTPEVRLDNVKDNFERYEHDLFTVTSIHDLGKLTSIRIRHDNTGSQPGCHLSYVMIQNPKSLAMWYFPLNDWLAEGHPKGVQETIDAAVLNGDIVVSDDPPPAPPPHGHHE